MLIVSGCLLLLYSILKTDAYACDQTLSFDYFFKTKQNKEIEPEATTYICIY